jgi:hypothetical protein
MLDPLDHRRRRTTATTGQRRDRASERSHPKGRTVTTSKESPSVPRNVAGSKTEVPPELVPFIEEIRALRERDGLSLTAIAIKLGRDKRTISDAGRLGGIRFDAASTAELCATRIAGNRMRRAKMSRQMLDLAQGRLDQIAAADPGDGQKLATTAAILLDKSVMLETREAEDRKSAEVEERMAELFSGRPEL